MNQPEKNRAVNLVNGKLADGRPFWCYVAVKKERLSDFMNAVENGTLDLVQFNGFGEIIAKGEGETPPVEIVAKINKLL